MAKKKQTTLDAVGGDGAKVAFEVPQPEPVQESAHIYPADPVSHGFVLKRDTTDFVGRDGCWTMNSEKALRFFSAGDAAAYNNLHCASAYFVREA